jgi:hypothetical protein
MKHVKGRIELLSSNEQQRPGIPPPVLLLNSERIIERKYT